MSTADVFVLDAVRTPFGRYGGALAGVRPDDLAAHACARSVERARARPGADRRRVFGDANGAGEDNRNVARMAVLLAGLPTSVPGVTVNRLCGSSLDAAMRRAGRSRPATRRCAGRRRGVDEPRAVGACSSRSALPARARDAALDHARLADGQPGDARAVDDLARREHREAGRHLRDQRARRRTSSRCAATGSPARRGSAASTTTGGRPGARRPSSTATRASGRHVGGEAGEAQAGVPPDGRDGHRRQRVAAQRRRGRAADRRPRRRRRRPARAAGADRRGGTFAVDPDVFGIGPVEAANRALARAGIGWEDVGRGRAQRGVRGAVARLPGRVAGARPGAREPERRRDRDRAPARRSGVRILGTLAHELRRRGGGWGVAAICIGVGQGLAVAGWHGARIVPTAATTTRPAAGLARVQVDRAAAASSRWCCSPSGDRGDRAAARRRAAAARTTTT